MSVRFVHNSAGFREILTSVGVLGMLEGKAEKVKGAAEAKGVTVNDAHGNPTPMPYDTESGTGPSRARARVRAVHPAGLRAELKHRALGASVDAARE